MGKHSDILVDGLATEYRTVKAMTKIYCRAHHQEARRSGELCQACRELLVYAETRLDRCPYGQNKPACNKCPIHCYKPEPKEFMRLVMRYSGPRMLIHHPILAIRHLLHERRKVPKKPEANLSNRHKRRSAEQKR